MQMYYIYSKHHRERGSEESNNSPLYWKHNLGEKVKRIGTLHGGEDNARERLVAA